MEHTAKKRSTVFLMGSIAFVLAIAAGAVLFFILFEGEHPLITVHNPPATVGASANVTFQATDRKSGLKQLTVRLQQKNKSEILLQKQFPRRTFRGSGIKTVKETAAFAIKAKGFQDGAAEIIITATDYSFARMGKGNMATKTVAVVIDTRPPKIAFLDATRYLRPGGSAVVLYSIDEKPAVHGVRLNGNWFPGFKAAAGKKIYGALVALPYNAKDIRKSTIEVQDRAGNTGSAQASFFFKSRRFRHRKIAIPDRFLQRKLPDFRGRIDNLPEDPVEAFLYLNGTLRKENAATIKKICATTASDKLWDGVFGSLPNSARMARYADHRTYFYHNKEIDRQVHLGADLASVQRAPVPAANSGVVAFTGYLGIYGNAVILDHGQGLFSLYAHLTDIAVDKSAGVSKGEIIGHSGATGMAGGDHLHFSMLVHGVFVTPLEWWDPRWVRINITDKLNP